MGNITPQESKDALTLISRLMQRSHDENYKIIRGLYDSVQRDLEEARTEISRIRRNVSMVLRRPHTDAMVAGALFASHDYDDPDARA